MALNPSDGWGYYSALSISGAVSDYQMKLDIRVGSSTNNDPASGIIYDDNHCYYNSGSDVCKDHRFGSTSGPATATQLYEWTEEVTTDVGRVVWVNISSYSTIYLFVGNQNASEYSDGDATFPDFFDDFNDGSFDTSKWNAYYGSPVEEEGYLKLTFDRVKSIDTFSYNTKIRMRWRRVAGNQYGLVGVGYSSYMDDTNALCTNQYTRTDYQTYIGYRSEKDNTAGGHATNIQIDTNWHISDIKRLQISCTYLTDGGEEYTENNTTYIPTIALPVKFYCRQSGDKMWVDWVFVAKYSSSEPSWSNFGEWTTIGGRPKHPITHLDKGPHPRSRLGFMPRLGL